MPSAISIKLQETTYAKMRFHIIEIPLRHGCSPVNLLRIFRTLSLRATLEGYFCVLYQMVSGLAYLFLKFPDKKYEVESVCIIWNMCVYSCVCNFFVYNLEVRCL